MWVGANLVPRPENTWVLPISGGGVLDKSGRDASATFARPGVGGNTGPKIPPKLCKNGATLFLSGIRSSRVAGFFRMTKKCHTAPNGWFFTQVGGRARGSSGAVLSFFAPVFLCGPSAIYRWGSIGTSKSHIEVYLCRLLAKNFLGIFCTLYVGYGEAFL